MSAIAIRVENLSKAYRIGLKEQQHETMLGALAARVKSPFRNYREVRSLSSFGDLEADHRPRTTDHGEGPRDHRPRDREAEVRRPNSAIPASNCAFRLATRTMKNSLRFEPTIARNLIRSSRGFVAS